MHFLIMVELSGKGLNDLENAPDVAYNDIMDEVIIHNMDMVWCVKVSNAFRRNLVDTWRDRPKMSIIT